MEGCDRLRSTTRLGLDYGDGGVTPIGVFRDVDRPAYDDAARGQVSDAREARGAGDLAALLSSGDTWAVG